MPPAHPPAGTRYRRTVSILVVRGGWPGHQPVEQTNLLVPYLEGLGHSVQVSDDPSIYADASVMASVDLIVQYVSMGTLSDEALAGLRSAVAAGAGFAGWHGGIVDSFRGRPDYLQLTGGEFVEHPGNITEFEVDIVADHPIVAGIDRFTATSEQYWVVSDSLNTVLATTTIPVRAGREWPVPVTVPVVWTRPWGAGRVFVCTIGHTPDDLVGPVRTIIERGLAWALR